MRFESLDEFPCYSVQRGWLERGGPAGRQYF
jgi:hypothetical protein